MTLKATVNMWTITVYFPNVWTIKPTMIADVKYQNKRTSQNENEGTHEPHRDGVTVGS